MDERIGQLGVAAMTAAFLLGCFSLTLHFRSGAAMPRICKLMRETVAVCKVVCGSWNPDKEVERQAVIEYERDRRAFCEFECGLVQAILLPMYIYWLVMELLFDQNMLNTSFHNYVMAAAGLYLSAAILLVGRENYPAVR